LFHSCLGFVAFLIDSHITPGYYLYSPNGNCQANLGKITTAGITDAITFLHNSISGTDYETLMRTYTETSPGTGIPASGIHKTIYDNMNLIKNNQLLTAYNNFSELDANYSSITVDLAPHYWKFISAISSTGFAPGVSVQPDTTEFVMTFTSGAFSKKLVYKLNK
jgi:hypothetical protein